MARPGCLPNCPFEPMPTWERVFLAIFIATLVLNKQLLDGFGVVRTEPFTVEHLQLRFSVVVPAGVLLLCGYYAYHHVTEKHHRPFFLLDMISLPTIVLGMFAIATGHL